jgi:autotransporter adhesin
MSTELPIATATNVGGMKTGSDIAISNEGVAATRYAGLIALEDDHITIGGDAADTSNSVVIGVGTAVDSHANDVVAIGFNSGASQPLSVACGSGAQTNDIECVAVGFQAQANNYSSVALGKGSVTSQDLTVSIGDESLTPQPLLRRITNMADAQDDTDAVNKRQMEAFVAKQLAVLSAQVSAFQSSGTKSPAPAGGMWRARSALGRLARMRAQLSAWLGISAG